MDSGLRLGRDFRRVKPLLTEPRNDNIHETLYGHQEEEIMEAFPVETLLRTTYAHM